MTPAAAATHGLEIAVMRGASWGQVMGGFRAGSRRALAKAVSRVARCIPLFTLGAAMVAAPAGVAAPAPTKVIHIYNNSPRKLYAVLETAMTPTDEWLQAVFRTTKVKKDTFAHTELYRVYIDPENGIAPGASASIRVPFYSQLVSNPNPRRPNQYIDWWNGGRVYLYDEESAIISNHNKDQSHPVTALTAGVSCAGQSVCEPLTIFSGTVGLPVNDPNQLTEYTFADVVTGLGKPYQLDVTHVDYDISYVDQVYLPVAIEPVDNKNVGYIGTVQDLPGFRKVLRRFLTDWEGWPTYVGTPPYPRPRIPGAYNVFIGGPDITEPGITIDQMRGLWRNCTQTGDGAPECLNIRAVNELFQKSYDNYLTLNCNPHVALDEKRLLQHVYGWVPFNENCENAASANPLYHTPGADYPTTAAKYIDLQYLLTGVFNPFVRLIHNPDFLHMNAYAFSIDDAVGNMNELGNGLIVAVGGSDGLVNKKAFDKHKVIHVNLGTPRPGFPKWKSYGVCSAKADQDINPKFLSFSIYSVDYPCKITVADSNDKDYQL
ncbi:MAG: hypothetical protein ABI906_10570, partial [Pseudomonadota bacterium]